MLELVLKDCVTDTNETPWESNSSMSLAKSASERVSRSTLFDHRLCRFGQPDGPLRDEVAEPARQPCRSLRSAWPVDRSGAPAATAEEDSVA
jgi:hypothetical protein